MFAMKMYVFATSLAFVAMATSAQAADMDRELGLIVSGVVDQWSGVQVVNNAGSGADGTLFASGTAGYLSIPLGDNLSIQNDIKIEYNENAFDDDPAILGPRYSYQGAGHLSYRYPSRFLLGVFGGMGTSKHNDFMSPWSRDYRFVGGEAQSYLSDLTLYGQVGYVDTDSSFEGNPDNAIFGRGVLRWFLAEDTRVQFEGLYMNVDNRAGSTIPDYDVLSWGARYDTSLAMPLIGNTPLYIAYRGTNKSDCNDGADQTDHTFMIGTSYSFSGSRIDVDRTGATLDTADFGGHFTCYNPQPK